LHIKAVESLAAFADAALFNSSYITIQKECEMFVIFLQIVYQMLFQHQISQVQKNSWTFQLAWTPNWWKWDSL